MESTDFQAQVIDSANVMRTAFGDLEQRTRDYVEFIKGIDEANVPEGMNKGECIAQAMLALRDVESARMRLGKVIQYADGGTSVYDKKEEEAVEDTSDSEATD